MTPSRQIAGIHHITAIAGDPQRNLNFYTRVIGLRLVKLTANFDDPHTYHLHFGNETARRSAVPHHGVSIDRARLAVILVHGRGGSPEDMLGLVAELHPSDVADLAPAAAGGTWYP
jgi:catechol 2,3-dioxygenase-like lactoylglutathione lyase family enzyme